MKAMTPNDRRRIKVEIRQEIESLINRKFLDLDTSVLFVLNTEFGFGKKRLEQFYKRYVKIVRKGQKDYEDVVYDKMREHLMSIGADVQKWGENL